MEEKNIDNTILYSDYISVKLNNNSTFGKFYLKDTFESKKYLLLLHKDKNLSDIMEMYDLSEKDLQKLSIVKLKVRNYKINFLLKQD